MPAKSMSSLGMSVKSAPQDRNRTTVRSNELKRALVPGTTLRARLGSSNILPVGSTISMMAAAVIGIAKAPQDPFRGRRYISVVLFLDRFSKFGASKTIGAVALSHRWPTEFASP
jgi:hypothetical protein